MADRVGGVPEAVNTRAEDDFSVTLTMAEPEVVTLNESTESIQSVKPDTLRGSKVGAFLIVAMSIKVEEERV